MPEVRLVGPGGEQVGVVRIEVAMRLAQEADLDLVEVAPNKLKRAEGFLQAGDKVKAMILFRGREQSRPEQGVRLLRKFAEDVAEFGTVESNPTIDGRNMVMVVAPHKNKSEVKTEQNAQRAANKEAARSARHADDDADDAATDDDE